MGDEWSNQFGMIKFANFQAGQSIRRVSRELVGKECRNSAEKFLETVREFMRLSLPTDEVFHYDSVQSEWEQGFGSEGYAIVRDGELVDTLVVKMN